MEEIILLKLNDGKRERGMILAREFTLCTFLTLSVVTSPHRNRSVFL